MMRQLDYQDRVLTALDDYLAALKEARLRAESIAKLAADHPELDIGEKDFAGIAWEKLEAAGKLPPSRAAIPFSPRMDGAGRPVPNAVLKVPTGGGKTYLAVDGVSRILGRYLNKNTGFVLWIVPNEAIYSQTLKRLRDRQHPYRQALDRAAAGRVRIMEKGDRLDARDVETNLCIMLLMLQSANRDTQDSLRMFRDRGDVHGFTPHEGDQAGHAQLIAEIPNLSIYDLADGSVGWAMVKDSLGNALRIIRPVVVMDEGHRAVSELAFGTLYGFNPCFVLELTATPQDVQPRGGRNPREARYANLLVEVTGRELDSEGMIKMPLNLDPRQGTDWKATLTAALDKLRGLDEQAEKLRADTGRYIRPIMLVQVERTGVDQRDSGHIHADDVKEWLLTAGFDEAEIAIKTAERNDLNQPENLDLLAPTNRVRAIITKQALQEGWDCPFAYVLCALSASGNLKAMTQLVGRILRQPDGVKTDIAALDECHVITHHAGTADVVGAVKKGLEQDGLADLVVALAPAEGGESQGPRTIQRRERFATTDIYLPKVLMIEDGEVRDLDYETDILSVIDWRGFNPKDIAERIPESARAAEAQIHRISLTDEQHGYIAADEVAAASESLRFDPAYAVRMISDIVLNAFVGREIVGRMLETLEKRGFDDEKIGELGGLIVDELRKGLFGEQAARAETLFKDDVAAGRIQFRLRIDGRNWQMPTVMETSEPENSDQLNAKSGGPLERSLFQPVYRNELNKYERDVAINLDGEAALNWWHRNVARRQYGLQGWRRGKIYPDFIFAVDRVSGGQRLVVLETKGDHLDNPDTAYKKAVLEFMTENFAWDKTPPSGTLELVKDNGETVECGLIMMSEWETKLPEYLTTGEN
jgi:type III restriction enzyme